MPTVCDFALPQNVGDSEQKISMALPANLRKIVYDMTLPQGARASDRAIVTFMVHATDPDDLAFKLEIGGHSMSWTVNSNVSRTFQEIVGPNVLNVTHLDRNPVTFEVTGGDGVLAISDVVLWFQRTI